MPRAWSEIGVTGPANAADWPDEWPSDAMSWRLLLIARAVGMK